MELKDQGSLSCELGLEGFWDVTLVPQINEGAQALASLGHVRWCPLGRVFSVGQEEGEGARSAVSGSGVRLRLSHSQHLFCP